MCAQRKGAQHAGHRPAVEGLLGQTLNARIDRATLEVRNDVQARMTEQVRWMVLTWGVVLAVVVGLYTR